MQQKRQALRFYLLSISIFLFLAINLQNISGLNQENIVENLDTAYAQEYNTHAASTDDYYAFALDTSGIRLYPGTTFKEESRSDVRSLTHCKSLVFQTLQALPDSHRGYLQHLTLYFADGRRGLGGGSTVILRCSDVTDKELVSVLVHEIGHTVDTGLYTGTFWAGKSEFMDVHTPIYNNDVSLRFYRISWKDSMNLKDGYQKTDFVTGYAMTDPFEDFAETYNFYVLHGDQFREMALYNKQLKQKYLFMKYIIFAGQEFDNDPYNYTDYYTRNYDATLLNYDSQKFLNQNKTLASL